MTRDESAIRIEPATTVPFADIEHAFTGGGDGGSCWCQWFLIPRSEFSARSREERKQLLRRELGAAEPSPALVAYVDDEPAAWVRVAPRTHQAALARTQVVKRGSDEPPDAPDVWAITCFVVRREHRAKGIATRLLQAAIDHARQHGARLIEAYPIDTERRKSSNNELFVGSARLFSAAGFEEIARPTESRVVMALTTR
ncbi:GNAT family N-acetyltransferase [Cryobacterium sp. BB736]|uniref:GNAT family N-acetyltransferase n=1 Tax=Cryobacterium sp. BB736 TaxID=2746963 RepID=UPI0018770FE4|nr:GNAT family N-acetyltransferase [Cryobacterium sp. BB736]